MHPIQKAAERVKQEYQGNITTKIEDDVLILEGHVDTWQQVVSAGLSAAGKGYYIVNHITCREGTPPPMRVPNFEDKALEGKSFDIVVIGGGVVGCAIAREMTKYNVSVLLCEKEHDLALAASSRNDGMVHPGIDLKKHQIKFGYNMRGNKMYDQVCKELQVNFKRIGQYVGVSGALSKIIMPAATNYWKNNGVPCQYLNRRRLLEKEPFANPNLDGALFFPSAGIVCPYNLTIAYAENAADNGATISLDTAVVGMEVENGNIKALHTNRGTVYPKVVVNAAGVFSDKVAIMAQDEFFTIHPRKGTIAILDKKAKYQVQTILSTLGAISKKIHSKGGGVVSTVDGNVLIGPDAIETMDREDCQTEASGIKNIVAKQSLASPMLSQKDIITYFAGVRAPAYEEDFIIRKGRKTKNIVHAAGIQSPGLTSAPAIGVDVARMAAEILRQSQPVTVNQNFNPIRKAIPHTAGMNTKERDELIKKNPDYGIIVCRCEEVSKGEIIDSLRRSVPCDTVDGVKRRTRPGMGRCKGGFCGPQVVQIIAQEKNIPPEQVTKNGKDSVMFYGLTKEGK